MSDFADIIRAIGNLVSGTFRIFIALALLIFLWGLVRFIINLNSEGKAEEGKNMMIWGVIALFVMLSVAGLINLLQTMLLGGSNLNL